MKKINIICLFLFLLFSCSKEKESRSILKSTQEIISFVDEKGDATYIGPLHDFYYCEDSKKHYLANLMPAIMNLQIVDLDSRKVIKSLDLSKTHKAGKSYGICFKNFDTIVTYEKLYNRVHLQDTSGNIFKTFHFDYRENNNLLISSMYKSKIFWKENEIILEKINLPPRGYFEYPSEVNYKKYMAVSVQDGTFRELIEEPNLTLRLNKFHNYDSGEREPHTVLNRNGLFVTTSMVTPEICIYDDENLVMKKSDQF